TAADLSPRMRSGRMPMLVPTAAINTLRTQHCLAVDAARHVGQAIAAVLAEARYGAGDAPRMGLVDYDVLPAVAGVRDAVVEGGAPVHPDLGSNIVVELPMAFGDVDAAFAKAPHVFHERMWQHRGGGNAMEPRCVLASHDAATDMLTVWSATQTPHISRRMI